MSMYVLSEVMEDTARRLLERHLSVAKEWFPHELVPWSQGRDFATAEMDDQPGRLTDGVASALWVGLLTEDNLPHYFHALARAFPPESAMGEWSRRWAAEEGRHSIVIRDWISVTRALDLKALERARMQQVTVGFDQGSRGSSLEDAFVYLALQELATRVSHWNTGAHLDATGAAVMRRVAADENLHFLFYRDMATALLAADPSAVVSAIDRQVTQFQMPGAGIGDFASRAATIAVAGIYDYRVHYEQILAPVILTHWRLDALTGLTPAAQQARDHVLSRVARIKAVADRIERAAVAAADMDI